MAVSLTVWDGAGVIGGNKILLQADGTNVFLDFGMCFSTRGKYYEEFLKPRATRGLLDPLVMGLLPPIRGIYRSDLEPPDPDLWTWVEPAQEIRLGGVLLSHAHLDHTGSISFLHPDTPVLTSCMTAVLCKAIQDSGRATFEQEVCYAVPRQVKDGVLEAGAYRTTPSKQRAFRTAGGEVVPPQVASFWAQVYGSRQLSSSPLEPASSVGSLQVRRYDVDHSVFGACAFAIQTTAGWVVYTGDLRCHGGNAEMTHRFALAARELKPILLVCEGTHVENSACVPESAVYDAALSCVRSSAGRLAVADFGARNIERLLTFLRIAEETDRRLAVTARDAFVLDAMRKVSDTVPDLRSERHIAIVSEPKASLGKWESEFVRPAYADQLVTLGDIRAAQGDFILCYSFFDVNDLVDVSPDAGGAWLYSASEAYNEEQVIDMQRLTNWVGHFKMDLYSGDTEYGPLHTSGHLSGPELLDLIRTINPRAVIPVHTERPEFFVDNLGHEMQVLPPQRGVTAHLG